MDKKIAKPRTRVGMLGSTGHGRSTLTAAISRVMARHESPTHVKLYEAIVCCPPGGPGRHASVIAGNLDQAKKLLEDRYGKGSVFSLSNKEDAKTPRS